jgi:ribonuclease P protein component
LTPSISSAHRFTFKKEERLSRKKLIDELFNSGSAFYLQPLKILILLKNFESDFPVQVLITVSSKNFPRAVDRNTIKRLIRESYRLNKHILYDDLKSKNKKLLIAIIYSSKKIESFSLIEEKVVASLQKIISLL